MARTCRILSCDLIFDGINSMLRPRFDGYQGSSTFGINKTFIETARSYHNTRPNKKLISLKGTFTISSQLVNLSRYRQSISVSQANRSVPGNSHCLLLFHRRLGWRKQCLASHPNLGYHFEFDPLSAFISFRSVFSLIR